MSSQTELNQNATQFIIYYCNSPAGQNDSTLYDYIGLSDVCTWGYDGSDNFEILTWAIGTYSQPSPVTLMSYVLTDVLNFYSNYYLTPTAIAANEPYLISTADLANIRADSTMLNYVVYDTTAQIPKYFNGTNWETNTSRYLHSTGGALSGNLDMSTNNILNVGSINSGGGSLYVSGGALYYLGSSATVTMLGSA